MRLMAIDKKQYEHSRFCEVSSSYVGTALQEVQLDHLTAVVSPISTEQLTERFGSAVNISYTAQAALDADVVNGDIIVVDGVRCKVHEVLKYRTHKTLLLAKEGAVNAF